MKMGFSGWIKKQSEKVKTNRVGLQFHLVAFEILSIPHPLLGTPVALKKNRKNFTKGTPPMGPAK